MNLQSQNCLKKDKSYEIMIIIIYMFFFKKQRIDMFIYIYICICIKKYVFDAGHYLL